MYATITVHRATYAASSSALPIKDGAMMFGCRYAGGRVVVRIYEVAVDDFIPFFDFKASNLVSKGD